MFCQCIDLTAVIFFHFFYSITEKNIRSAINVVSCLVLKAFSGVMVVKEIFHLYV
jgi:hypothetical protein